MANIHIVLQGKGGVGKSVIASLLAQYLKQEGKEPLCIDTDPVNATLFGFKGINVQHLQIMEGDEINPQMFDSLVEIIGKSENDVIVDNGASSFVELSNYLIITDIPSLLESMGHTVIIHTVITGGTALLDTLSGFSKIVTLFPDGVKFVVWLNPHFGPITIDGKGFFEFKAYKNNEHRVTTVIEMPVFHQTFAHDLNNMLMSKLTFDEALKTPALPIVTRQRLTMIRRQLYEQFGEIAAIA